jgi:hypothetical protein
VHDHLSKDIGLDNASDGAVVSRWTQLDQAYDDDGDESVIDCQMFSLAHSVWKTYMRRAAKMAKSLTRR